MSDDGPITDDMIRGAAVGWRLAHDEACSLGPYCSRHQPIEAEAQRGRLVAALVADVLGAPVATDEEAHRGTDTTRPVRPLSAVRIPREAVTEARPSLWDEIRGDAPTGLFEASVRAADAFIREHHPLEGRPGDLIPLPSAYQIVCEHGLRLGLGDGCGAIFRAEGGKDAAMDLALDFGWVVRQNEDGTLTTWCSEHADEAPLNR